MVMASSTAENGAGTPASGTDVHGRRQIPMNVLSSWAGQLVLIVSGFIMPRLIDRNLGQAELGVWDFGWSLISHFGLVQAGLTGSINRYVAHFRAQGDLAGLNRSVSSVAAVLRIMGGIVLILTVVCVWVMPYLLETSLSAHLAEARWLVLLLGTSLAVQISASVYGGVLTGCHRWDWHNGVYSVTYAVMLGGMIAVVKSGHGLIGLAMVNLGGESLGRFARFILAQRVCPGLEVRHKHVHWPTAREMIGFGGKMFVRDLSGVLLGQTISLLILTFLGPAALALFSRPAALVRMVTTFVSKYANVFTPTTSSLHSTGASHEVGQLTIKAVRYNVFFCLPPLLFLMVMGGDLLGIWMGGRYANAMLIALLAGAYLFSIAYSPLYHALCGTNQHGRASLVMLVGSILGVSLAFGWLAWFRGGLLGLVVVFGAPWTLVNGVYLPIHACRRLGISLREFLVGTWKEPLLCCVPFTLCLSAIHWYRFDSRSLQLACGILAGGTVLFATYWMFMVPDAWKEKIKKRLGVLRG